MPPGVENHGRVLVPAAGVREGSQHEVQAVTVQAADDVHDLDRLRVDQRSNQRENSPLAAG